MQDPVLLTLAVGVAIDAAVDAYLRKSALTAREVTRALVQAVIEYAVTMVLLRVFSNMISSHKTQAERNTLTIAITSFASFIVDTTANVLETGKLGTKELSLAVMSTLAEFLVSKMIIEYM
jgi:hypothetical protein